MKEGKYIRKPFDFDKIVENTGKKFGIKFNELDPDSEILVITRKNSYTMRRSSDGGVVVKSDDSTFESFKGGNEVYFQGSLLVRGGSAIKQTELQLDTQ